MTAHDPVLPCDAPMAGRLLAALLPHDRRDELIGDLEEEYARLATASGAEAARRWYAGQILLSIYPMACRWLEVAAARRLASWSSSGAGGNLQIGRAFFIATLIWIAFIGGIAPHRSSGIALPALSLPAGPSYTVSLRPQAALPAEPFRDGDFGRTGQEDFLELALIPPMAVLIGMIAGLALSDRMPAFPRKSILSGNVIDGE